MNANVNATPKPLSAGTAESHYTAQPGEQAARHGAHHSDVLHEVTNMDWTEENVRDEKLLSRLDLETLNQDIMAHGDGLATLVGQHNDKLLALTERSNKLAADRMRLVDFKTWADGKLDDVLAERARLVRESWDWLLTVRTTLAQREAILKKAEEAIKARLTELDQRRQRVVEGLRRSMAKVRREMIQASPSRGESHFADLLEGDDAVVAIDQERAALQSDLERVADRRRRAGSGQSTVLMRQEEAFKNLLN